MLGRKMAPSLPEIIPEISHQFYRPDFSSDNKLYEVCEGFNNQIDMMMQKPQYAQRLQSELTSVDSDIPASELYDNDVDISASCEMRQFDTNEVSEFLENKMRDEYNKQQSKSKLS